MQIYTSFYLAYPLANTQLRSAAVREKPVEALTASDKTGENSTDKTADPQQQQKIQALKSRDQEVKAHEQAHLAAAGGIAIGGANYNYAIGPDGRRYAMGGDVSIDISEVPNDPQATMRKAETIRRAALAPAQPSAQDYSVASKAAAMAGKAAMELLRMQQVATKVVGSRVDAEA